MWCQTRQQLYSELFFHYQKYLMALWSVFCFIFLFNLAILFIHKNKSYFLDMFFIIFKQHNLLEIIAQWRNQMYPRCGKQGPDKWLRKWGKIKCDIWAYAYILYVRSDLTHIVLWRSYFVFWWEATKINKITLTWFRMNYCIY